MQAGGQMVVAVSCVIQRNLQIHRISVLLQAASHMLCILNTSGKSSGKRFDS